MICTYRLQLKLKINLPEEITDNIRKDILYFNIITPRLIMISPSIERFGFRASVHYV